MYAVEKFLDVFIALSAFVVVAFLLFVCVSWWTIPERFAMWSARLWADLVSSSLAKLWTMIAKSFTFFQAAFLIVTGCSPSVIEVEDANV